MEKRLHANSTVRAAFGEPDIAFPCLLAATLGASIKCEVPQAELRRVPDAHEALLRDKDLPMLEVRHRVALR